MPACLEKTEPSINSRRVSLSVRYSAEKETWGLHHIRLQFSYKRVGGEVGKTQNSHFLGVRVLVVKERGKRGR